MGRTGMRRTLNRAGVILTRLTILVTTIAAVAVLVGYARRAGF